MVSLVKGLAASPYAVVHSVPYQYQLDNFQQVKNVWSIKRRKQWRQLKQEKTAWQLVNLKADFLLNEQIW